MASKNFPSVIAWAALTACLGAACGKSAPPVPAKPPAPALTPPPAAVPEPAPPSPTAAVGPWQQVSGGLPELAVTKGAALTVARVAKIEGEDPYAPLWKEAPFVEVMMLPQQMAMPILPDGTIPTVQVQAVHDGTTLAVRLVWRDATPDGNVETGRFADAVAVELPLKDDAPPTMGSKESPVQILHWKALWQKDLDVGYQDVQDLHPNYWSDLYWFAEPGHPHKFPEAFKKPEALQWFVALAAGNPVAVMQRATPAEELIAGGWGTLTHQPQSATRARGLWAAGKWAVMFTRPLHTDDASDAQLTPGKATKLAFAVWDGGKGQIGGRKHWAAWQDAAVAP